MTYRTIVADPPWDFTWGGGTGGRRANATVLGYETMHPAAISAMFDDTPLPLDGDATLFLWATQDVVHEGYARDVAHGWGFPIRVGEIVWCKPNFGTGVFPRIGHETCLIYKRGRGSLKTDRPRNVHSVQTWAQHYTNNGGKSHSAKPEGFYDLIEQAQMGPYLELFARRARFGWDYWGDQSLGTAEMVA